MSSTQFKLYSVILPYSTTSMKEEFRFVYKGVEYDATDYAEKHPGGLPFLKNMKAVTKDFTEYFRYQLLDAEHFTPTRPKKC